MSEQEQKDAGDVELLTLNEAAAFLGLAKDHKRPDECMRYLCRQRRIRYIKIGRHRMFMRKWLLEFLEQDSVPPLPTTRQ